MSGRFLFAGISTYIYLNPLRAKAVVDLKELDSYIYCGHSVLMGKKKREWQDVKYILGYFGKRIDDARKKYRSYVEKGIKLGEDGLSWLEVV